MRTIDLLLIDDELMDVLRYCTQLLKIIEDKYGAFMKTEEV